MAFPDVAAVGTVYNTNNTTATSHPVDLPAGFASGDRLMILFEIRSDATVTLPEGWTQVANVANGTLIRLVLAERTTDGGTTATLTTSSAVNAVGFSWRVTGSDTAVAAEAATAVGTSATPDPPSLTPSWGSADSLWAAGYCHGNSNTAFQTYPTNYADDQATANTTGGAGGVVGAICSRSLAAVSEDPGTFGIAASRDWAAITFAVSPGGGGQTVAVGQATETDTAQAVTAAKTLAVGQSLETDTAQPLGAAKTVAIGQAVDTSAAQPLTVGKSRQIGQPSEADLAQPLGALKALTVGQATETDTALTLAGLTFDIDLTARLLPVGWQGSLNQPGWEGTLERIGWRGTILPPK